MKKKPCMFSLQYVDFYAVLHEIIFTRRKILRLILNLVSLNKILISFFLSVMYFRSLVFIMNPYIDFCDNRIDSLLGLTYRVQYSIICTCLQCSTCHIYLQTKKLRIYFLNNHSHLSCLFIILIII